MTKWKTIKYLKTPWETTDELAKWEYELILPEPLASWDVFSYWERERTLHMRDNLRQGEILFDIGAEHGWLSVVYASMVGAENMVLIEPTKEFWANIKATWEKNLNKQPLAFWDGFFGDQDDDEWLKADAWPISSTGELIERNKYQNLHEDRDKIKETTIDVFVKLTGVIPDALTIDVEGAELLVLKGAENTLRKHKPKIWVSIHPDLMKKNYKNNRGDVVNYLHDLGYSAKLLAKDHEEHWYFDSV